MHEDGEKGLKTMSNAKNYMHRDEKSIWVNTTRKYRRLDRERGHSPRGVESWLIISSVDPFLEACWNGDDPAGTRHYMYARSKDDVYLDFVWWDLVDLLDLVDLAAERRCFGDISCGASRIEPGASLGTAVLEEQARLVRHDSVIHHGTQPPNHES